jgi:hypothetical protein
MDQEVDYPLLLLADWLTGINFRDEMDGKPLDLRIHSYYLPVSLFAEIAFAQRLADV